MELAPFLCAFETPCPAPSNPISAGICLPRVLIAGTLSNSTLMPSIWQRVLAHYIFSGSLCWWIEWMNEWMRFLRRNHLRAKFSIRRDRRSWEKILSRSQALLPFSKLRSDNVFHIYKIYGFKKCSFYHPDNLWERLGGVCYPSFMDVEAEALGGSPVAQGPATAERPDLSSQASSRAIFLIAEAGVWLDYLAENLWVWEIMARRLVKENQG